MASKLIQQLEKQADNFREQKEIMCRQTGYIAALADVYQFIAQWQRGHDALSTNAREFFGDFSEWERVASKKYNGKRRFM